jgi:phosphatidylglycerophosphatase A
MNAARFVASGGGAGLLPRAPGTWGSLAALAMGAAMLAASPWLLAAGTVAATIAGFWAIPRAGGDADPGWVVIDEVAGMWLTMLALPAPSWIGLALAFALFRLLDIAKPGPIGAIDRWHGAAGVMCDDLAAGFLGAALLYAFCVGTGWP